MAQEWRDSDAISVAPQRRYQVTMHCADGRAVRVTVQASTIETVIDQVKGRRIACPGDLVDFVVSELGE